MTEKGSQVPYLLSTLRWFHHTILGNCEYAIEKIVNNENYASHIVHYLNHVGKGGIIRQALSALEIDYTQLPAKQLQDIIKEYLKPCFEYLRTLPTTLHLNNFIFVL